MLSAMRSITIFLTAIFLLLPSPGFSKYPRSDTVKAAMGNIREKPSVDARVIQRVYRGDTVTIHRLEGKWFYIKLPDGTPGWAHRILFKIPTPKEAVTETKKVQEIKSIQTVIYSEMEEKVLFTLSGSFPPQTSTLSGDNPKVVCDFAGVQPTVGISDKIIANGKFIRQIKIDANEKGTQIFIILSPDYDYHIEQVFFEEEKVYSLIFRRM